jgi:SAM-dependent methyltransferase
MQNARSIDYSEIASYYDQVRAMKSENLEKWISGLTVCGGIREGTAVLEIGCGTGQFTIPLWESTRAKITGIDPSTAMIRAARRKEHSDMITWARGSAEGLPFPASSFACAFMCFVIQHIQEPLLALQEAYRVLCPGGRLIIATASQAMFRSEFLYGLFPGLLSRELARFPSIPALKQMLADAGFRHARSCHQKGDPEYLSTEEYAHWIEQKPLSTFFLLSEDELVKGLEKLRRTSHGVKLRQFFVYHSCWFVLADKPGVERQDQINTVAALTGQGKSARE